jgi:hypothetical protein
MGSSSHWVEGQKTGTWRAKNDEENRWNEEASLENAKNTWGE